MRNALRYDSVDYADSDIRSAQAAMDTSLSERTLDVDTMTATVDTSLVRRPTNLVTSDGYRFVTADGYVLQTMETVGSLADFAQNEPAYFLRDGSQYALWYLKSVTRVAPQQWTLSMMSSLGRLTQMAHKGGVYNGVAASTIIDDICGVVPHYVSLAFADVLLYGYLPYVSPSGENGSMTGSAKDNLLKVLFALNATVRDDASGTLRIENLSTAVSSTITADRIYRDNAVVRHEPPITSVTVLEHQYIAGGEETTLFDGTTTAGQIIVFDQPMSDLAATGFTIMSSGANYAVVSAGTGTLAGRKYIHTTREITRTVTSAAIPNPARIEDATLVGITNSSDVVNRLADYYAHRTYIECDATVEYEDAGDVVSIFDPFDKIQRDACIEKISPLTVSQTMKGRISALVGFTPWQVVPFEDVRELLTGSGTWTAPADLPTGTEIQVVLIGGGQGGSSGNEGEAGGYRPWTLSWSGLRPTTQTGYCPTGGKGGAAGDSGSGGRILRASVVVSPGQQISYSCGSGGAGGAFSTGNDAGSDGADTSFGDYSSAVGAVTAGGYEDPITKDVYADDGKPGIAGGDGGGFSGTVTMDRYFRLDPAQSVVDEDGNVWNGGATFRDTEEYERDDSEVYVTGDDKTLRGDGDWSYGGGGCAASVSVGGGAAAGSHGTSGGTTVGSYSCTRKTISGTNYVYATAYSLPGINGADATVTPHKALYGKGGTGGYGGGGGSGCSWSAVYRAGRTYDGTVDLKNSPASGGAGGAGSAGGDGGDGCIILYYRRPVVNN